MITFMVETQYNPNFSAGEHSQIMLFSVCITCNGTYRSAFVLVASRSHP